MEAQSPNIHILTHNLPLPFPLSLPPSYPPVSSSHLTPSVSQGPIKSPLPPSPEHLSSSLSFSQMSPSFFSSYSHHRVPRGWFNFSSQCRYLCCPLCSLWQGMMGPEFVCMSVYLLCTFLSCREENLIVIPTKNLESLFVLIQKDEDFFSPPLSWITSHKHFLLAPILSGLHSFGQDFYFFRQALWIW